MQSSDQMLQDATARARRLVEQLQRDADAMPGTATLDDCLGSARRALDALLKAADNPSAAMNRDEDR